jgi:arsenate reductase
VIEDLMKNILFLCTGNSCRSQMAEGWAKKIFGNKYNIYSAGTKKHGLNQRAIQVMSEAEVDITDHESNITSELQVTHMDYVFTVCSDAHENCPYFPGGEVIHIGFDDPPRLTNEMSDEEEILNVYRRVRDEIRDVVRDLETYMESA